MCGSARVVAVCDLTVGYDSTRPPDYKPVSIYIYIYIYYKPVSIYIIIYIYVI